MNCEACDGTGKVTNDQHRMSALAIATEIENDKRNGAVGETRTEIALATGALSFVPCEKCGGTGFFEVEDQDS